LCKNRALCVWIEYERLKIKELTFTWDWRLEKPDRAREFSSRSAYHSPAMAFNHRRRRIRENELDLCQDSSVTLLQFSFAVRRAVVWQFSGH
jgi:hypothetical protein